MNPQQQILKQYWGYDQFRPLQEEIVINVLQRKNTLAILPTGGGKSVCFQLPAVMLEGLTIVVSPLIALMEDQVSQLNKRKIPAAYIHSNLNLQAQFDIYDACEAGKIRLLYIAPERISNKHFQEFITQANVPLIAIDEAHCISQWGHDFRPQYLNIKQLRDLKPEAVTIALTASATPMVIDDIVTQLGFKLYSKFQQSVIRQNISYQVVLTNNVLNDIALIHQEYPGTGIVYCRSRKKTAQIANQLSYKNIDSNVYHAGLNKMQRDMNQRAWTDSNKQIIAATTAFGMGIDKPNVRKVIHIDLPESIESYYQEAGRGGRDGKAALAIITYAPTDIEQLKERVLLQYPGLEFIKKVYNILHDYLQLGIGDGFEQEYTFDIVAYCKVFDLNPISAIAAVKALERNGYFYWKEDARPQPTVKMEAEQDRLLVLQRINPNAYKVTNALLRLYGGLYYTETIIDEYKLAKFLEWDRSVLIPYLQYLDQNGVLKYKPSSENGTLYFLQERLPIQYFKFNVKAYTELRANAIAKAQAVIDYIQQDTMCRNKMLAIYFGEEKSRIKNCGTCDNCKKKEQAHIDWQKEVVQILKLTKSTDLNRIFKDFNSTLHSDIIHYLRFLEQEGWVTITNDKIYWKK